MNAYSNDFNDAAKCKEIALDQIPQGSDVVFQVAGDCGLGALDAACEKDVTAIGVDADQSVRATASSRARSSRSTDSVFGVIDNFTKDDFKGGTNESFGVEQICPTRSCWRPSRAMCRRRSRTPSPRPRRA